MSLNDNIYSEGEKFDNSVYSLNNGKRMCKIDTVLSRLSPSSISVE
jgi:hypothetical protein